MAASRCDVNLTGGEMGFSYPRATLISAVVGLVAAIGWIAYISQADPGDGPLMDRFSPQPDTSPRAIAEGAAGESEWKLLTFRSGREYCARVQLLHGQEISASQHCSNRNVADTVSSKWQIAQGQAVVLYGVASESVDLIRAHFGSGSVSEVAALLHQEFPVRFFVIEIPEGDFLDQISSVDAQGKVLKDQIPLPHLPRDAGSRPSASPSAV